MADSDGQRDLLRPPHLRPRFVGATFYDNASGFTSVTASATNGVVDAAYLYDSPGNDTFTIIAGLRPP